MEAQPKEADPIFFLWGGGFNSSFYRHEQVEFCFYKQVSFKLLASRLDRVSYRMPVFVEIYLATMIKSKAKSPCSVADLLQARL